MNRNKHSVSLRDIMKGAGGTARTPMQKTINDLVQLQELLEARAQQETMSPGSRLEQLDAAIKDMADALPDDLGPRFQRLHHRHHLAIVPVTGGNCSGCGIQLPVSLTHAVRGATDAHACPNCARFLYALDAEPEKKKIPARRTIRPTGIARFSAPELMLPHLDVSGRDEAIRALCECMAERGYNERPEQMIEQALRREAIVSTAIENGLAFPHVRGIQGGGITLAVATCPDGLEFNADLGAVTRILFFVLIPGAASAFYLQLLSGLIKSFGTEAARNKLIKAATPDALWKVLIQATRKHIT